MGPEYIPLIVKLAETIFVFGLGVILIVGMVYLEDWRKIRRGKKMANRHKLAWVSWECPRCSCSGGYSDDGTGRTVGLCMPSAENKEIAHCAGCGWVGDIDDATITVVGVPRQTLEWNSTTRP